MIPINLLNQIAKEINDTRKRLESFGDEKSEYAAATEFGLNNMIREGEYLLQLAYRHRAVRAQDAT